MTPMLPENKLAKVKAFARLFLMKFIGAKIGFLLKSLDVTDNFTIYAVVFLASSVLSLISFAGIGVREMLFLQASKWFSFQPEISVSASLLFTMITAFFSLFGVIFQIRKLNLKLTETP